MAEQQTIIIKKVKGHGHGHHGGAWKVAYADFVTAMMAFFLLLWLLNATTEEQRNGIADYFSPESISSPKSGAGGILGGKTVAIDGSMTSMGGPSDGASVPLPPLASGDGEGGEESIEFATGDVGETELPENGTPSLPRTEPPRSLRAASLTRVLSRKPWPPASRSNSKRPLKVFGRRLRMCPNFSNFRTA